MTDTDIEPPPRRPPPCESAEVGTRYHTNIDRRQCSRVVPLQVMCLGVSRTGTASLRQGLLDLGYSDCYHYSAIISENPRDAEMWVDALESKFESANTFQLSGTRDWDKLLGHCAAVTDTPCAVFYKELLAAYPEAKVILTVRDSPKQWWESQLGSVMLYFQEPTTTWQWLRQKLLPTDASTRLIDLLGKHYQMYNILKKDQQNGIQDGMKWYESYNEEIKRIVPADRLLVMNVKEGWDPLCKFLGKERPAWAWPRVNDRQSFARNYQKLDAIFDYIAMQRLYTSLTATAGCVIIAGFGFWLHRRGW